MSTRAAIDAALRSAERVTLTGSMTPALIRFSYSPLRALKPSLAADSETREITTKPSKPAFWAIQRSGWTRARRTMSTPASASPVSASTAASVSSTARASTSAVPPPATMPSSRAARVEDTASSMRCLRSFSSTSVAAPTLITPMPPASLARRSESFSRSHSESVRASSAFSCDTRSATSSAVPAPSTMVVESLVMVMRRAEPSTSRPTVSRDRPRSGETTCAPVMIAMSCSMALRRSPKPGALTATAFRVPRILFTTRVERASPSMSSAMMNSGLPAASAFSSSGRNSATVEILPELTRISASSRTASWRSASVTNCGDR